MGPILDLDPYSGLSSLSVTWYVPVPHSEADTGSFGSCWGKKEHIESVHVPLMIGTEVFHSLGIPASAGNLVSHVRADGNGDM